MPFINTKTNVTVSRETEERLKVRLAKAITLFPGKSEEWLMLCFEDQKRMWFHGENATPMAFSEVQLLGDATKESCDAFTEEICRIFREELGILPAYTYVKFEFVREWGWNSQTF